MQKNYKSTRWYSARQEKSIAKAVSGKLQANSGATLFSKGDIKTDDWLFEAKTCMKQQQSFGIKVDWLAKLKEESFAMNKEYYALVFNFGPLWSDNFYVLDEKIMKKILKILSEEV